MIVELVALDNAEIKYSMCRIGIQVIRMVKAASLISLQSVASVKAIVVRFHGRKYAITWKYPSCILQGDLGEFYSVAGNYQQADTGTKMYHLGKNTTSTIISKGISAGHGNNTYRGLVKIGKGADNAKNYTQCDSLMISDECGAHTNPYIECKNNTATIEHEATTSKIGDDQMFYLQQRGLDSDDARNLIVNGFCKDIFSKLPMEFAVEANKLLDQWKGQDMAINKEVNHANTRGSTKL